MKCCLLQPRWRKGLVWMGALSCVLGLGGPLCVRFVPLPAALFEPLPGQIELVDRHGDPLRIVRPGNRPYGQPVPYADIPQALVHATLAAEDKRFWRHPGVDWRSSVRAFWSLVKHRRIISGGSTITQQLIKLAQPRPRTVRTKILEALQALRLEQLWPKQRILAEYLNRIEYGNLNRGCAAAADFYFDQPLIELSPAQCAFLAGLPQAPSRLNPVRHLERAQKRQRWILERMIAQGYLTAEEFARAQAEPLRLAGARRAFHAPHFVDLWLAEAAATEAGGKAASRQRAGRIQTTLDLSLNRLVQESLRQQLRRLESHHVRNGAAVVIDNQTGGVLALVGSEDYFSPQAGQVNGVWATRSAGSTAKPFLYLLALEQGATPSSVVADTPAEFITATGVFAPVNYDHRYRGPVRYRVALANSLNVAAVKVLASVGGPPVFLQRLQDFGLMTLTNSAEHYGLGLAIGNAEVRLLELANAYAGLARLGENIPYSMTLADNHGTGATGKQRRRVADQADCYLIADILSDNAARTLAFGAESSLRFMFPVACKTGTSSDFRDNWAMGYTPEFTVGVWTGNFDGSPMQEISGVTGAAPVLHDVLEYLHQRFGTSWFVEPETIIQSWVHPITGKRRNPLVQHSSDPWIPEKFRRDLLPPLERAQEYDGRDRVRLPAEYAEWFRTGDNALGDRAVVTGGTSSFAIAFPPPGTKFFLDPDLPDSGRCLHLRTLGGTDPQWASTTLEIRRESSQIVAVLSPGKHQLEATDAATGATSDTWIEVVER